jgi:hypothetical protein
MNPWIPTVEAVDEVGEGHAFLHGASGWVGQHGVHPHYLPAGDGKRKHISSTDDMWIAA